MAEIFYVLFSCYSLYILFCKKSNVLTYRETDFLYTCLGDDVSNSFTARLFRGFPSRISRYLKLMKGSIIFNNLARPGFTSKDLLMQLVNNYEIRQCLKNSDIITISIGGNNLLAGVKENYTDIDGRAVRKGLEQFREDWPRILHFIRNHIGSEAKIYVMSIYNPYNPEEPNYSIAEYYINGMNSIINNGFWIKSFKYLAVDVHRSFKLSNDKGLTLFNSFIREPLPGCRGHRLIAEEFISVINASAAPADSCSYHVSEKLE